MRFARTYLAVFLSLVLAIPLLSQRPATQSATSSPQALALLQKSLAALTGGQTLADVTLTGTARRIAGSAPETGAVTFKAISDGSSRLDFTYPSGTSGEIRSVTGTGFTGAWSGPDGVTHLHVFHNLMNTASIFPGFTLAGFTSAQSFVITLLGQETKNGAAVYHLSASQQDANLSGPEGALPQHLSQVDVFLNATTLLPVAFDFTTHPDDDAELDLPVELLFSEYRSVSGPGPAANNSPLATAAMVPFHIQKFLNNTLLLDLQFSTAQLNSGLSASLFNVQ